MKLKIITFSLLSVAASNLAFAQATQVILDKSHIRFVSKQMGVPVEGRFKKFDAKLNYDPAKPEATRAEMEVDLGSIDLGAPDFEDEAKKKDWFNTTAFPKAMFKTESVKALGNDKFEVKGTLTIKGISKPIVASTTLKNGVAEGTFTMKRLAYNIGEGSWKDTDTVADDVEVRFRLVLSK